MGLVRGIVFFRLDIIFLNYEKCFRDKFYLFKVILFLKFNCIDLRGVRACVCVRARVVSFLGSYRERDLEDFVFGCVIFVKIVFYSFYGSGVWGRKAWNRCVWESCV